MLKRTSALLLCLLLWLAAPAARALEAPPNPCGT